MQRQILHKNPGTRTRTRMYIVCRCKQSACYIQFATILQISEEIMYLITKSKALDCKLKQYGKELGDHI